MKPLFSHVPGSVIHLPHAVCPSCESQGSIWLIEQAHGTVRVCTHCGYAETDGKVEGLKEFRKKLG